MLKLTDEQIRDIKSRYPDITIEERTSLSITDWYKCRILFYENSINEIKSTLQDVFKNGKNWTCSNDDLEWYKSYVRDLKNSMESEYKNCMNEYQNHREGLNYPTCYVIRRKNERVTE